jgi:hypothetical protein
MDALEVSSPLAPTNGTCVAVRLVAVRLATVSAAVASFARIIAVVTGG